MKNVFRVSLFLIASVLVSHGIVFASCSDWFFHNVSTSWVQGPNHSGNYIGYRNQSTSTTDLEVREHSSQVVIGELPPAEYFVDNTFDNTNDYDYRKKGTGTVNIKASVCDTLAQAEDDDGGDGE